MSYLCSMIAKGHMFLSIVVAVSLLLTGCSPQALHEAQEVVAEADSLRTEGVAYTDSVTIAEAYNTLEKWQYLYPTDYARACYYYGRLLRNNDDPVAAMQVFINATHTNTRDYHILGRTYSNMGSICHLANEFQLSYDMYSRSADLFLLNGDTLLYYCLRSDMAFECAKQGKQNRVYTILDSMPEPNFDRQLLVKNVEAHLILCKYLHKYDSVLYYADSISKLNGESPMQLISKAQAFCYIHQYDSATYYAQRTIATSSSLFNLNNALYILIHCDSINNGYKVYGLSSERADVQKLLEIRQGKLSQATQLLEQDLHRRPNLMWLYAIIGTLVAVGIVATIYIVRKCRRRQLLSQQISDLEHITKETAEDMLVQLENRCAMFHHSANLKRDLCWNDYEKLCTIINQQFFYIATKLQKTQVLTESEIRLCFLILIGLNRQQISEIFPYAINGIGKFKYRVANKLGIEGKNLRNFLINMAIGN